MKKLSKTAIANIILCGALVVMTGLLCSAWYKRGYLEGAYKGYDICTDEFNLTNRYDDIENMEFNNLSAPNLSLQI